MCVEMNPLTDEVLESEETWMVFRVQKAEAFWVVYCFRGQPEQAILDVIVDEVKQSGKSGFLVDADQNPQLLKKFGVNVIPCVVKVNWGETEAILDKNLANAKYLSQWLKHVFLDDEDFQFIDDEPKQIVPQLITDAVLAADDVWSEDEQLRLATGGYIFNETWSDFVIQHEDEWVVYCFHHQPDQGFLAVVTAEINQSKKTGFLINADTSPRLIQRLGAYDIPCVLKVRSGVRTGIFHNEQDLNYLKQWLAFEAGSQSESNDLRYR